jgi:hypothetical protein
MSISNPTLNGWDFLMMLIIRNRGKTVVEIQWLMPIYRRHTIFGKVCIRPTEVVISVEVSD